MSNACETMGALGADIAGPSWHPSGCGTLAAAAELLAESANKTGGSTRSAAAAGDDGPRAAATTADGGEAGTARRDGASGTQGTVDGAALSCTAAASPATAGSTDPCTVASTAITAAKGSSGASCSTAWQSRVLPLSPSSSTPIASSSAASSAAVPSTLACDATSVLTGCSRSAISTSASIDSASPLVANGTTS